ncbi:hypothetical protein CHLNCDRAFT_58746 [Chlorella variabilis]|uniref:UspA domain-containing protein n=1 Tax=Chlorella variabilis TaxID=554065 RepID=E1ZMX5_CHLVA|nr:hypothetical protein CHLNCDRAFT_58746 [Chlorella variabilis]EFN52877.1 hypothetical protein CHLNCDRAFT_58746 [Chlorella variabilis]|eukprot:XP_005844979.1 hypothetical protein CHLNCDRAFT_58746 [Chlorella variabilis]
MAPTCYTLGGSRPEEQLRSQKQTARPPRCQPRRLERRRQPPSPSVPGAAGPRRQLRSPSRTASIASSGEPLNAGTPALSGRNILVAADNSEDSKYALQWTVQELYRPGDVITVAHCIPYLPLAGGMYAVPDGRLAMVDVDHLLAGEEQYLLAEQRALERTCADAFQQQQVAHVVDIMREDPMGSGDKGRIAAAMCRKAEDLQAAVLVIASQAKSGLSEFLLGSVAAHCVAHSHRPVLVLHAPKRKGPTQPGILGRLASATATALGGSAEPQHGAAALATEAHQPSGRNIVLAVDDSDESEKACSFALSNLYRPGDTFHMLRIIPTLPYRAALGGQLDNLVFYNTPEPLTDAFKSATQRYVKHRFEPKLQAAGVPFQVDIIVEPTDESVSGVGESICSKADELQAAAVVLGSHMHGGMLQFMLGSVASYVALHCRAPVAVLH